MTRKQSVFVVPEPVFRLGRKKAKLTTCIRLLQDILKEYPDAESSMHIVDTILALKNRREKLDQP